MDIYSWSSSTCLSHATSAGVCNSAAAAALSALTSAGWDSAGRLWLYMWSWWFSSSGRHTLATSCLRPTAHWLSSCLRCVPGHCWWVCCSSGRSGENQFHIWAILNYDGKTLRNGFKHLLFDTFVCQIRPPLSHYIWICLDHNRGGGKKLYYLFKGMLGCLLLHWSWSFFFFSFFLFFSRLHSSIPANPTLKVVSCFSYAQLPDRKKKLSSR